MDYQIRHHKSELDSTGYMEIGPGKYMGLHWQDGFVFIRDDAFSVVEGIIKLHFSDYDHLEMNDISKEVAKRIISDLKTIASRLATIDRADILQELHLAAPFFSGLEHEIDSRRTEVAVFLRSIAEECEKCVCQSDWICILGM